MRIASFNVIVKGRENGAQYDSEFSLVATHSQCNEFITYIDLTATIVDGYVPA